MTLCIGTITRTSVVTLQHVPHSARRTSNQNFGHFSVLEVKKSGTEAKNYDGTQHRRCKTSLRAGTLYSGAHFHCQEACSNVRKERIQIHCSADPNSAEMLMQTHRVSQSAQYLETSDLFDQGSRNGQRSVHKMLEWNSRVGDKVSLEA